VPRKTKWRTKQMKTLKFLGPQDYVNTIKGKHIKGETKGYPDDLARELLEDKRFEEVKTGKKGKKEG